MSINFIACILAATYATYSWNDPTLAFGCGLNVGVATWCFFDFLKKAAEQ